MPLTININDKVRVKLTPHGKTLLGEDEMLFLDPVANMPDWFDVQLWHLTELLGANLYMGCILPIETDIFVGLES